MMVARKTAERLDLSWRHFKRIFVTYRGEGAVVLTQGN
jgi:hypothetical protein